MTLAKAVEGSQISKLKRVNEGDLIKALKNLILSTAKSLSITNTVNEVQIFEASLLIMEEFPTLKLEELVLIFKNAKLGRYGKTFNRLDIETIGIWIDTYLRSEERAIFFEKENSVHKKSDTQVILPADIYKNFSVDQLKTNKDAEEAEKEKFRQARLAWLKTKPSEEKEEDAA